MIDFFSMFLSVLFAFIVKDFYDTFIQNPIKKCLMQYKLIVVNSKKNTYKGLNKDK